MTGVRGVAHVTLLCSLAQLPSVQEFYEQVLGLRSGPRPSFAFPGAWLYAGKEPIIHLAAVLDAGTVAAASASSATSRSALPGGAFSTGSIDHVALRASGTVAESREKLAGHGIPFTEAPVPDFPLYQLFLSDPLGVKIELNFELEP
ncbi:MAG: glyoxalase/bleomycin resistance protein/dioxygenase [Variovorax sp.]|jgi:catechol 2,3-dioxygenase-like lactoylglutathione lyase family enzyme|nr:glyoxalase/bleomycin resistance protein/dioxygenase [Variovorax sp.]